MKRTGYYPSFVIMFAGFFLSLPAIIHGFPLYSHDVINHALWLTHFSEQLWHGDLYPRWLSKMNGGLGSPAFFYYPPVAYYFSSVLRFLLKNDPHSLYQLGLSSALALAGSGLCAYLWLKTITNQTAALIGSIFYMAMPYHLFDLYVRGAFSEFWSFVWLPLVLYFAKRTSDDDILAAAGLAVSYALLIMTHIVTALIFSIVPICYAFFIAETQQRKRRFFMVLAAMILGAGLSAVFLVPALTMQEFISMYEMHTGYLDYGDWFLTANAARDNRLEEVFAVTAVTLGLAWAVFFVGCFYSSTRVRAESAFWMAVILLSCFMMTALSRPIWQLIPLLQTIQFPWRFNVVIVISAASLIALSFSSIKRPYRAWMLPVLLLAGVLVLGWLPLTAYWIQKSYPTWSPDPEQTANVTNALQINKDAREYRPRWAPELQDSELLQAQRKTDAGAAKAEIDEGEGTVTASEWRPRNISLLVNSESGVTVKLSQFYYPGWVAQIAGTSYYLDVVPSRPDGLLRIAVPKGDHRVLVQLSKTRPEYIGEIISLVSVLIVTVLVLAVFSGRIRRTLVLLS